MEDLKFLTVAVGDLNEAEVLQKIDDFLAGGLAAAEGQKLLEACQQGMDIVGERFEKNEYFVGDLIFAGELLTQVVEKLKPVIEEKSSAQVGKILLATVQGDMHDIGKNIFKSIAEANGFKVYDLGVDQPVATIVQKIKELQPDIVGMSGLLGFSLDAMEATIAGIKEAGLRDGVKIILGGQAVTPEFARKYGADAATTNAQEGIKNCLRWVS